MLPPFPRIVCALSGRDATDDVAIERAVAVADGDARVVFAAPGTGRGSPERAVASERHAREAVARGVVVVGSSGRLGLAAVGSVSERVAQLARCSVLVMRGR